VIEHPIPLHQVNQGRCGFSRLPYGFYRDDEGNLLSDTLFLRAGPEPIPNAMRNSDVVTLQIDGEKVSPVGRKPFEFGSYERSKKSLRKEPCQDLLNR
jgi:hypothetical protein